MNAAAVAALLAPVSAGRTPTTRSVPGFDRVLHDELSVGARGSGRAAPRNRGEGALHRDSARPAAADGAGRPGSDGGAAADGNTVAVAGDPAAGSAPDAAAAPADGTAPATGGDAALAALAALAGVAAAGALAAPDAAAATAPDGSVPAVASGPAGTAVPATGMAGDAVTGAAVPPAAPALPTSTGATAPAVPDVAAGTVPDAAAETVPAAAPGGAATPTATASTTDPPVAGGAAHPAAAAVPATGADPTEQPATSPTATASATAPPVVVPTPAPATGAAGSPAPAPAHAADAAPSVPVADQLGARLRSLGGLRAGRHVLSVPLDPEHLGPVRVVAHISADVVRVDLVGTTDASRDALRGALSDLRRDLADAGLNVEVGLGGGDARQDPGGSSDRPGLVVPHPGPPGAAGTAATTTPTRAAIRGLDVLA